jgi:hypothetical protein
MCSILAADPAPYTRTRKKSALPCGMAAAPSAPKADGQTRAGDAHAPRTGLGVHVHGRLAGQTDSQAAKVLGQGPLLCNPPGPLAKQCNTGIPILHVK